MNSELEVVRMPQFLIIVRKENPPFCFCLLSRIRWLSPPFETVNGAVPGIGRATVLHRSCMSPKVICMNDESLLESC
jgi:hypothetical protein